MFFWNSVDTLFSFLALKNGLTPVTYATVVPTPTVCIRFVVGKRLPLYRSLSL